MKSVLINFPESLLSDVNGLCNEYGYQFSEFIRSCVRERIYYLNKKSPQSIDKQVHAEIEKKERTIENVKKETTKLTSKPTSAQSFTFCPKHNVFYASCGCMPKKDI